MVTLSSSNRDVIEVFGEHHPLSSEPTTVARLSATNALLDRAYGKPAVKEEKEIVDLPPVVIQIHKPEEDATE